MKHITYSHEYMVVHPLEYNRIMYHIVCHSNGILSESQFDINCINDLSNNILSAYILVRRDRKSVV